MEKTVHPGRQVFHRGTVCNSNRGSGTGRNIDDRQCAARIWSQDALSKGCGPFVVANATRRTTVVVQSCRQQHRPMTACQDVADG